MESSGAYWCANLLCSVSGSIDTFEEFFTHHRRMMSIEANIFHKVEFATTLTDGVVAGSMIASTLW